jgi:hypothetical protein
MPTEQVLDVLLGVGNGGAGHDEARLPPVPPCAYAPKPA